MRRIVPAALAGLSVPEIWAIIERWLAATHPSLLDGFAPPASAAEIRELERALGAELPDDYRASLAVHAGNVQRTNVAGRLYCETVFEGLCLLTPEKDHDLATFYCIDTVPPSAEGAFQIAWMCTKDIDRFSAWASFREMLIDTIVGPIVDGTTPDADHFADPGTLLFES